MNVDAPFFNDRGRGGVAVLVKRVVAVSDIKHFDAVDDFAATQVDRKGVQLPTITRSYRQSYLVTPFDRR